MVVRSLGNLQQEALRSALAVAGRYLYHQHAAFETLWALRYDGAVRPGAHSSLLAADVHASRTLSCAEVAALHHDECGVAVGFHPSARHHRDEVARRNPQIKVSARRALAGERVHRTHGGLHERRQLRSALGRGGAVDILREHHGRAGDHGSCHGRPAQRLIGNRGAGPARSNRVEVQGIGRGDRRAGACERQPHLQLAAFERQGAAGILGKRLGVEGDGRPTSVLPKGRDSRLSHRRPIKRAVFHYRNLVKQVVVVLVRGRRVHSYVPDALLVRRIDFHRHHDASKTDAQRRLFREHFGKGDLQSSAPRIEMGRPLHDGIYILGRRRRRARRNRRGVAFERLVAQRGAVGFGSVGRPAEGHGGHDVHARSHHVGRFHAVVAERGELP